MKCPSCQAENPEGTKFCGECGSSLQLACPKCGLANAANRKFCSECGFPLEGRMKKAPEAERKQVTVLFSDLSGYTVLTEKLDPEEVKEIMSRLFGEIGQAVAQYEGHIYQLIGDQAMILFGVPKTHEDDPFRAIRTAQAIHARIEAFSPQFQGKIGRPLSMHSGIHTGLVVTGELDLEKGIYGKITGDTINLAARLSDLAPSGEIWVGPETHRRTQGAFTFEALRPTKVQGKAEPIQVYKVLPARERHVPTIYLPGRMVSSEMVGRSQELNRLKLQVMKAINGEGSIVNVIGEAGIGKSRLIAELKKSEVMQQVALLEGRAISMGRNLSFHPIMDLIRSWSQIQEDEGEASAFRKLEVSIRRVHPQEAEEILPFLATLMGMKLSGPYAERVKGIEGEALETLILKSLRDLLAEASERVPLVILIEDLHWADASSLGLLEFLFRLGETHRILFLNVFRPGHKETGDRILATLQERYPDHHLEIPLQPLAEQESEELIHNLLQLRGLPPTLRDQIVERASGNPFFLEEVVRSLIDEGAVVLKDGAFQVTEKIEQVVIPSTIQDVLMARIDRLDEETKNLVKTASVIGRSFFYRILTEVARKADDIDYRLAYLKDVQLILERQRMEELEYLFKHALAQEAAYESILLQRRKEIHLQVAQSIEKVFSENLHKFYGMLAYHYSRGEAWEKAEEYLLKAGDEALASSASREALHYFQEGLKLYLKKSGEAADPQKIAMLEKKIGLSLLRSGQLTEAADCFDKALSYYGVKTPKHPIVLVLGLGVDFLSLLMYLYLPFLRRNKIPNQEDCEIVSLMHERQYALVASAKRYFIAGLNLARRLNRFDLRRIENGVEMYAFGVAGIFSWGGLSLKLGRKILDCLKGRMGGGDSASVYMVEFEEIVLDCMAGHWGDKYVNFANGDLGVRYDENITDYYLRMGKVNSATNYVFFHMVLPVEQGGVKAAQKLQGKLSEMAYEYEADYPRAMRYPIYVRLLVKFRHLKEALIELEAGLPFLNRTMQGTPLGSELYAYKAQTQMLLGDSQGAEDSLRAAQDFLCKTQPVPWMRMHPSMAQLTFDLYRWEESSIHGGTPAPDGYSKKAYESVKVLIRNAPKVAPERTEAYKLVGTYYWLAGRQKKALKWWGRSIAEGERLHARPELARSYLEVGRRLLEPKSKYQELNGLKAEEYLEKARALFEEMDLQWDLNELEKVKRGA